MLAFLHLESAAKNGSTGAQPPATSHHYYHSHSLDLAASVPRKNDVVECGGYWEMKFTISVHVDNNERRHIVVAGQGLVGIMGGAEQCM